MSMRDAMSGAAYDRWLTTDRAAEAAEAAADAAQARWEEWVRANIHDLEPKPYDLDADPTDWFGASDPEHAEHTIYSAWLALEEAIDDRRYRLEAEAEAAMYAEGEDLDREYDEHEARIHAEEAAIARYEAAMEAKADEMNERGVW